MNLVRTDPILDPLGRKQHLFACSRTCGSKSMDS